MKVNPGRWIKAKVTSERRQKKDYKIIFYLKKDNQNIVYTFKQNTTIKGVYDGLYSMEGFVHLTQWFLISYIQCCKHGLYSCNSSIKELCCNVLSHSHFIFWEYKPHCEMTLISSESACEIYNVQYEKIIKVHLSLLHEVGFQTGLILGMRFNIILTLSCRAGYPHWHVWRSFRTSWEFIQVSVSLSVISVISDTSNGISSGMFNLTI